MRRSLLGFVSLTCLVSSGTMYRLQWAGDGRNGEKSEKELDETQGDITFVDEKSMYACSKRVGFIHFKDRLMKI